MELQVVNVKWKKLTLAKRTTRSKIEKLFLHKKKIIIINLKYASGLSRNTEKWYLEMWLAITLSFLIIWLFWCSWKTSKTNVCFRRSIKSTLLFTEALKAKGYLVCEMETLFIGSTFWLNYEQLEDSNLQNKLFSIRQFVAGIKIKLGIYTWQFHLRLLFPREHKALKRIPIPIIELLKVCVKHWTFLK